MANAGSRDVSGYTIDRISGALSAISGSPFPVGGNPSHLTVDSTGQRLYVADSGRNEVFAYNVDPLIGSLTGAVGSPFLTCLVPFSVAVDPSLLFIPVVNQAGVD